MVLLLMCLREQPGLSGQFASAHVFYCGGHWADLGCLFIYLMLSIILDNKTHMYWLARPRQL
jgi:hypothetical protein